MDVKSIKQNKWFKRSAWALGSTFALWAVAWLTVPALVKHQVEKLASEQLGRRVTLGEVDFKPWSLELTVRDLAVARAQGVSDASPQFSVKRFYIDAELQSLVRLAPVVDALEVQAPQLSLSLLGQGRYDVDDILARLNQPRDKSDKPDDAPLSFALYNLALTGGTVDFTDKTVNKTHAVRDLQITLPFLSNLDSKRTVQVQPRLAFQLNASQFDSSAQATPFAQTRKTDATLKLSSLDLAPYLAYIPASLPVKLTSAVLDADLQVAFEQSPRMAVKLSGLLQASKVNIVGNRTQADTKNSTKTSTKDKLPDEAPLLAFDQLKLSLADVRPLERMVHLAAVEWTGPALNVHRSKSGKLNLMPPTKPQITPEKIAACADSTCANTENDAQKSDWKLTVDKVLVGGGSINWQDDTPATSAHVGLRDVSLDASGIAFPFVKPLQFASEAQVLPGDSAPKGAAGKNAPAAQNARLVMAGQATDQAATVNVTLSDVPLGLARPYLAQAITPTLRGVLSAELGVNWQAAGQEAGQAGHLLLQARQLTVNAVALEQGKTSLLSVGQVQVEQAQVDVQRQSATVGKLRLSKPSLALGREPDGRWMFENWSKAPQTLAAPQTNTAAVTQQPGPKDPKTASKTTSQSASPWTVTLGEVALEAGSLGFVDKSTPKPVAFDLSGLSIQVKNFSTAGQKPFLVQASTRIRAGQHEPGLLTWRGSAALTPLVVQGSLDARRVPVHAFEPYLADALNIELLRAEASFKGQLSFAQSAAGPVVKLSGDSMLEDFQANTLAQAADAGPLTVGEELLSWKLLNVRGLDVALAPGSAPLVAVRETVLSDFYARLILSPTGKLNLQDVMKPAPSGNPPPPAQLASASATASATASAAAGAQNAPEIIAGDAQLAGASGINDSKPGLAPVISFGPVSLLGGTVHFSDRFIQPNYSANLTELSGRLSAFSSKVQADGVQLADLELRGRAQGTASLEILGKVNPLASPLALDIKGRVKDLELAPLSPYSVRYAGYGIERGKLNVEVGYLVLPNGQLTASNNIVLNQLTFGDKVEGAPASLPVKLAVALLADRQGVIDINLPISGSLNDPQFRLGPLVIKLIFNLIGRAITSPFSLLASAFGGGSDELSVVAFAPGSSSLEPAAKSSLEKIAKALSERPALRLTVVGSAHLETEREAFRREQLHALVRAEKRRTAVVAGGDTGVGAGSGAAGSASVGAGEYPALLKAVYKRADFPRPRNVVGMLKDLPVPEMEALLMAQMAVTSDAMKELALQRSVTVRDYLATQKLPTERMFLGAAKVLVSDAKWSPRAELNLAIP
ncbi:MAG: DUF748 domain-containing protein [Rhodoferax sp.]|nr:DUF748 domain-containing protein [Rhodoferax sp.]